VSEMWGPYPIVGGVVFLRVVCQVDTVCTVCYWTVEFLMVNARFN